MQTQNRNVTKGVTFRIPDIVIESLQKFATKKQVSLNTLANQIFKSYVEWDSSAVEAGWMIFPKISLKELIDKCSTKELDSIAKHKAEYHKDIRLLMLGQNDIDGFFTILRQKCQHSGFPFSETRNSGGVIRFVIQHDLGEKWSYFNKILYEQMINDLGYKVDIETTKNTVVLTVYL